MVLAYFIIGALEGLRPLFDRVSFQSEHKRRPATRGTGGLLHLWVCAFVCLFVAVEAAFVLPAGAQEVLSLLFFLFLLFPFLSEAAACPGDSCFSSCCFWGLPGRRFPSFCQDTFLLLRSSGLRGADLTSVPLL